jgi:RNA polymerase sigma factor (sigma-70 family)
MKDYVIHAKLKNNRLLSRILSAAPNVAQFCHEHGLSQGEVGDLVNLKKAATLDGNAGTRFGEVWCKTAVRLAEIFGCLEEDLFSEEQRTVALKTNEAYIEMSKEQALASISSPENMLSWFEDRHVVSKLIANTPLSKRQAEVLIKRFDEEMSLKEIGDQYGLSVERTRQIEAHGLRKLRRAAKKLGIEAEDCIGGAS